MSAFLKMSDVIQPDTKIVQEATRKAFKGKLKDSEIDKFLDETTGNKEPVTITAMGSLYFIGIYGVVSCTPSKYPYTYEESSWGIGASAISAGGVIYTVCATWKAFFKSTTGYHAQGIAEAGGILQINFFNKLTPIGQFNAVAGGNGVFQVGGRILPSLPV